jgi:hypothetical protein
MFNSSRNRSKLLIAISAKSSVAIMKKNPLIIGLQNANNKNLTLKTSLWTNLTTYIHLMRSIKIPSIPYFK